MTVSRLVETIDIGAAPAVVWSAVSDPTQYGRWSPEATGARRRSGSGAWGVGDRFVGTNRLWMPWFTQCRVTEARTQSRFAFDVDLGPFPVATWSFELEPLANGGTRLTQTWVDRRTGVLGTLAKPAGLAVGRGYDAAARNRTTMSATLAALKADLER